MIVAWVFAAAPVTGISIRDRDSETTRSVIWAARIAFMICLVAEIAKKWHF